MYDYFRFWVVLGNINLRKSSRSMDEDMSDCIDEKLERLYPVYSAMHDNIELMDDDMVVDPDSPNDTSVRAFQRSGTPFNMDAGMIGIVQRPGTPIDMSMYTIKENFEYTPSDMVLNLEQYTPNISQITGGTQMPVYNCPKPYNSTAREIWLDSGLRECATPVEMEYYLSDWLTRNEYITHSNDGRHKIEWISRSGVRYKTTWDIFMKWMMISCIGEIPA